MKEKPEQNQDEGMKDLKRNGKKNNYQSRNGRQIEGFVKKSYVLSV